MNTPTAKKIIALTVAPNPRYWIHSHFDAKIEQLKDDIARYMNRLKKDYDIFGVFELGDGLQLHFHAQITFYTEHSWITFIKSVHGSLSKNIGFTKVKQKVNEGWLEYMGKEQDHMKALGVVPFTTEDVVKRSPTKLKLKPKKPITHVKPISANIIEWAKQAIIAADVIAHKIKDEE